MEAGPDQEMACRNANVVHVCSSTLSSFISFSHGFYRRICNGPNSLGVFLFLSVMCVRVYRIRLF